jgi:hypothetical protein
MSEPALTKVRNHDADLAAEAHEKRVVAELNAQHLALREQAQALIATVKGRRGIQSDEHWQALFQKAKIDYDNGRFLLQQLGAERYLEPELMATLAQLRQDLLAGINRPTAADTISADIAIIAYRNLLRVQGWIGSLCLTVKRELFGQAPLDKLHGLTVGKQPRRASASTRRASPTPGALPSHGGAELCASRNAARQGRKNSGDSRAGGASEC